MFIVALVAIIIDGAGPLWFCVAVLVRELLVGGTIAVATIVFGMERFDVNWWGKLATALLMFAIPGFMLGASDIAGNEFFQVASWILGIPGLILSLDHRRRLRAEDPRRHRRRAGQPGDFRHAVTAEPHRRLRYGCPP